MIIKKKTTSCLMVIFCFCLPLQGAEKKHEIFCHYEHQKNINKTIIYFYYIDSKGDRVKHGQQVIVYGIGEDSVNLSAIGYHNGKETTLLSKSIIDTPVNPAPEKTEKKQVEKKKEK
jgi:hypothetical protein